MRTYSSPRASSALGRDPSMTTSALINKSRNRARSRDRLRSGRQATSASRAAQLAPRAHSVSQTALKTLSVLSVSSCLLPHISVVAEDLIALLVLLRVLRCDTHGARSCLPRDPTAGGRGATPFARCAAELEVLMLGGNSDTFSPAV